MYLSDEVIEKAIRASKFKVTNKTEDFYETIRAMEKLSQTVFEVDVEGVEPTYHGTDLVNIFREDEAKLEIPRQAFLDNAPSIADGFIQVPEMISNDGEEGA